MTDAPVATQAPRRSKRAFVFIMITLMIDAMGIGLIIPVMPDLLQEIDGGTLGDAAIWGGVLTTLFAVMQFTFGPAIGSLSDRFGRRPVLLVSLAVMAADYLVMATAQSLWLLFVARAIGGITAATQSTATAFIADISKPEEKAANFGLVGAAFGIGFVLGPVIGGLLGEFGTRAPFYAAAGLAALNLVFGYFVLPETVTDRIRRPFLWKRANPFAAFAALGKLPEVTRLLVLVFLYEFAFIVYPATWAFYGQAAFGWDSGMVGLSLGAFGIAMAIVQGGLIRWIIPTFGERRAVTGALAFNFVAFMVLVFLQNGLVAIIFTPFTALGAIITPTLQGMMSRRVADDSQGELQGVIASTKSVAQIFAPLVMTQIFWAFTADEALYLPGAPFALSALLMLVCLPVFFGVTSRGRRKMTKTG
ncbi:TCR/Tet family MFS transporter [Aestuariibius sp. 2305UL40-4]|uniref:TCR/Tet family MFS transporter n=1 Tax=Aestuariibius violaceus TaxID=3234132 RepID=UPI00345E8CE2